MFTVIESDEFRTWFLGMRDLNAQARVGARIRRASQGNLGDTKSIGDGLSEMRIDYGPGYRVYFMRRGPLVILLLCGGDKRRQAADIKRAKRMAAELE